MLRMAQKPMINIPKMSMATILSGAVGPRKTRYKQKNEHKRSAIKQRLRKFDCQLSIEGTGQKMIMPISMSIAPAPISQRILRIIYSNILINICSKFATIVFVAASISSSFT